MCGKELAEIEREVAFGGLPPGPCSPARVELAPAADERGGGHCATGKSCARGGGARGQRRPWRSALPDRSI
eukprot:scaffold38512_cov28-Tisochrysis_lutea.AAC.2